MFAAWPQIADVIASHPIVRYVSRKADRTALLHQIKCGRRLEEAVIEKYQDYARMIPTLLSAIAFQQLHGAASRVRFDERCSLRPEMLGRHTALCRPSCICEREEDAGGNSEQPVRDAYGPNFERLAALKNRFDQTNFLTGNGNIKLSR
jgi:hypothetical protein